jgi:hypothetical protein
MANEFIARNGIISKSNLVVSGSLTALSSIVAQTLVVQTITSSISSITGSTNFGSLAINTHSFTGSMSVSGSGTFSSTITSLAASGQATIIAEGSATNGEGAIQVKGKNSSGTSRSAQIKYDNSDVIRIATASPINMQFETNDVSRLTINGSTGAATFSSTAQNAFLINSTNTDGPILQIQNSGNNLGLIGNAEGITNGGTTNFAIRATNNLIFSTGGANPRMTITSGGNVGIGTSSPDIFGRGDAMNVGISATGASDNMSLQLNAGGSGGRGAQIYMGQGGTRHFTISSNVSETRLGTNSSTPLVFESAATERMRITSTGALSIRNSTQPTGNGLHSYFTSDVGYIDSLEANVAWRNLRLAGNDIIFWNGGIERMKITSTGGINTYGPYLSMDGSGVSAPPSGLGYGLFPHSGVGLGISSVANGISFWVGSSPGQRLRISDSGFTASTTTASDSGSKTFMNALNTSCGLIPTPAGTTLYLYNRDGGTNYRVLLTSSTYFTGQHGNKPVNEDLKTNIQNHIGLIVSSTGAYYSVNPITQEVTTGKDAIQISEALPEIKLTDIDQDKAVWGVVTNVKNDNYNTDGTVETDNNTEWGDRLDSNIIRINGLGEGAIWITNINGNIENGDYICSSTIPGYGRKQNDDLLHNYTVAKSTMNCDFDLNNDGLYVCEEFEFEGQIYKKAFVGCTYHCS